LRPPRRPTRALRPRLVDSEQPVRFLIGWIRARIRSDLEHRRRARRTQMDCYLVLRRFSSSTGRADVTASRCHAATSNAVVGDTRLSSVRDASLDGTTHCCQSGGTHEPRSTSPVRSSPRRLGRANAIHSADAIFRDCATWATSRASHSLRRPSNSTRRRPEPICAASPVAALVRPEGVAERRISPTDRKCLAILKPTGARPSDV
jgi:hypothetical protein